MTGVLVAVVMGGSVVRADLPASGGSQTNIYVDGSGDIWAAHVFTADGTLTVSEAVAAEYLIVAGGGGGGGANYQERAGGGGGAGGLLSGSTNLSVTSYSMTIGSGGSGGGNNGGTPGVDSAAFGLTAVGGGEGGGNSSGQGNGGSGGGAWSGSGGTGTSGQGHDGAGSDGTYGGGGGGATSAGFSNGTGGTGVTSSITGELVTYAEGGNGGLSSGANTNGAPAAANTGSGGSGGQRSEDDGTVYNGGDGGSGIVVVRYQVGSLKASGGSQTNAYIDGSGDLWAAHIFTADGTLTVSEAVAAEYLIVAGGGGGGGANYQERAGGGGGAGGLLSGSTNLSVTSYSMTIGSGGSGGGNNGGTPGVDSAAFGLTAVGGGEGGGNSSGQGNGGSGGGAWSGSGGTGTSGQGHDGAGSDGTYGGGGGGATSAGFSNGTGGTGVTSSITGELVTYAEGGNGGLSSGANTNGAPAAANTGSGGSGGQRSEDDGTVYNGGDGGSGIVVVRYLAGGDSVPPEIDTLSPTNNATDLFLDVDLVATFDEIILTNTAGSVVITNISDSFAATTIPIGDSSQISVSGDTLTINPSNTLAFGKSYAVLIATNALTDIAGNFFADMTTTNTWTFQTLAPSSPVVTNLGPDEVLDTTARLNGMVTATYGDPLTDVRMYIGTNDPGPQATGWDTNYVITAGSVSENTPFAVVASNLLLETEYSYRVYVSNSADEAWSAATNFTTLPELSASGGSSIHYYTDVGGTSWIAHVFADVGSDNFIVDGPLNVEYLIVAGGGGGGSSYNTRQAGGGGAGGLLSGSMSLTASTNSVTVGAGGVGGTGTSNGGDGGNSSALGLTAEGGGGGAYAYADGGGNDGGCGGGGGSQGGRTGGTGSQGGDGADGDSVSDAYGGGGGGTSANGSTGSGGSGHTSAITGTSETYAQGGDGGIKPASAVGIVGVDALDNTGSGGGGSSNNISHAAGRFAGGAGGSGIVVVRYLAGGDSLPPQITPLSPTNNATGVLVDTDFTASFDEVVETNTTGAITITNLSDNTLVTTIAIGDTNQVTVSGSSLTINPTNDLAFATDYAVLIDSNALQDLVGNAFAGITDTNTWAFRTIVPDAPAVTNTGATRVGAAKARLNGQITTFNGVPLRELRIYFGTTDGDEIANDWDTNYVFDVASIAEGVGFSTNVTDLLGTQSYSYRVYASNDYGHAWSDVDTFTTEVAGTVTIDDTVTFSAAESSSSFTPAGFDPRGADKLIATISYEKGFSDGLLTSVSYNGTPMVKAIESVNGSEYTFIYYQDSPSGVGALSINSEVGGYGGSLLAISGTRSGVGPTNATQDFSATVTTERDNTFVVASYVENTDGSGTSAAQSPLTAIFTGSVDSADGASGYQYVSNASTEITATFDGDPTRSPATAVAGFEGVDPPAGGTLFRFR